MTDNGHTAGDDTDFDHRGWVQSGRSNKQEAGGLVITANTARRMGSHGRRIADLSLSLCVSLFQSLSVSLSVCLSVSVSLSLSVSLLSLSLSPTPSLSLWSICHFRVATRVV